MEKNLEKLMKQNYNHPESRLSDDIWYAIKVKQTRNLKIQSLVYSFIGAVSLCGFVFMSFNLEKHFVSSSFFSYVSLSFSDGNILATYWKEYLLSLADSFPFASLGVSFFLLISTLVSLRKVLKHYKYSDQLLVA